MHTSRKIQVFVMLRVWVVGLLVMCVFMFVTGCSRDEDVEVPQEPENARSAGSESEAGKNPGILYIEEVEALWHSRTEGFDLSMKADSNRSRKILIDVIKVLPKAKHEKIYDHLLIKERKNVSFFDRRLVYVLVDIYFQQGDRKRVVELLSRRAVRGIYISPIEWYLVRTVKNIEDPILILVESYEVSGNDYAKRALLEALASAFPSIRQRTPDNDKFVQECRQWYTDNKENLVINFEKYSNGVMMGFELGPVELFILKEKGDTGRPD